MIKVHLSRLMGEKKMKIVDLAKETGLHRNGITKLYYDKTDGIKFDTLDKLCVALDCKVEDLIEFTKNEDSKQ